ncbi:hypothetical protein QW131_30720 [Roseibium salinum]|nr:hypothetical protein [Roseibium salinum]
MIRKIRTCREGANREGASLHAGQSAARAVHARHCRPDIRRGRGGYGREHFFPGPQISKAIEAGTALYGKLNAQHNVYQSDLWVPQRNDVQGVSVNRGAAVQEGLTLYTTGDKPSAYLIDAEGNVVHEWSRPFSTVWSPGKGDLQQPQPDSHVYFRHAHAFPNGDLLAIYEGVGDTPYGYGMVKLNRDLGSPVELFRPHAPSVQRRARRQDLCADARLHGRSDRSPGTLAQSAAGGFPRCSVAGGRRAGKSSGS